MLSHIRDAKTPKEAWENLNKIFVANTMAHKLQLRQELNNIQQKDMSVLDYTAKIKSIYDSLGSININLDKDEMVQVCLVEKNNVRTKAKTSKGQMFFSNSDDGRR